MNTIRNVIFGAMLGLSLGVAHGQSNELVIRGLTGGDCRVDLTALVDLDASGNVSVNIVEDQLSACGLGGGAQLDVTLTVDSNDIQAGESVRVQWDVQNFEQGVTNCQASGGTSQWQSDVAASPDSGDETYTLNSNTTFTLDCTNSGDSAQQVVNVSGGSGNGPDGLPLPPEFCPAYSFDPDNGALHPDGLTRSVSINLLQNTLPFFMKYEDLWGVWPNPGSREFIGVNRGQYISIGFQVPVDIASGVTWTMSYIQAPNSPGWVMTLSRCPGVFDPFLLEQEDDPEGFATADRVAIGAEPHNCIKQGGSTGNLIGITGSAPSNRCNLLQGNIYYLNVQSATYDVVDPTPGNGTDEWTITNRTELCTTNSCTILLGPQ